MFQNGENPATSGKIINEFHYNRICDLFKDHGGEVVMGNPNAHVDKNLQPSIVLNPKKDSPLMTEEVFGPIFPLLTYKDLDEAIEYVREEQEKPLVVYYFGKENSANQEKIRSQTSSGAFVANEAVLQIINLDLPFGGVGASGSGRYHGVVGFKTFSNSKSVLIRPNSNAPPKAPAAAKIESKVDKSKVIALETRV